LTAFAEHALPQHEQEQTLAHLAACADCRQVVFLAQQAVEDEVVAAEPVRARRPWFSGWNPVWPALVAVAGMVAFSVHLRNVAKPAVVDHGTTTAAIVLEQPTVPLRRYWFRQRPRPRRRSHWCRRLRRRWLPLRRRRLGRRYSRIRRPQRITC